MTKTTMSIRDASIFSIGVGLAVLLWAIPASAAPVGLTSRCFFVNPNRHQCNFPASARTLTVQYVSMQCGSTGTPFALQEFQFLATPPNTTSEIAYQIPITNQQSLGGVVNAGSPVSIYARAGFAPRALIDLTPAPVAPPGTQCTVSFSGTE